MLVGRPEKAAFFLPDIEELTKEGYMLSPMLVNDPAKKHQEAEA